MRSGDEFVKVAGSKLPFHQEKPMKRVRHSLLLTVCVLMISSVAAQEKRGRTFVDALEQAVVGDPQLSPDGKQVLFTIDKCS